MVFDAIINWMMGIWDWAYQQGVQDGATLAALPTAQQLDLGFIQDMNYFLPISEMFGLFIAFFALGGPMAGTSLIIWAVIGVLRGGSTKA